jgi:hypothetical protein
MDVVIALVQHGSQRARRQRRRRIRNALADDDEAQDAAGGGEVFDDDRHGGITIRGAPIVATGLNGIATNS